MESKFRSLRALDVADEYKMHADLFLKTTMMFIGPFISSLTERHHRKLDTSQPFDLMELKGLLQTYEPSRYLDRSKSTAFMAASALAHTRPGSRQALGFNQQLVNFDPGAGAGAGSWLTPSTQQRLWVSDHRVETTSRWSMDVHTATAVMVLVEMHDSSRWCQTVDLRI
jgi:hypothetical protein